MILSRGRLHPGVLTSILPQDAINALTMANDKVLRGRKLAVTHAHQAPLDQHGNIGTKTRKTLMDTGKPTALSMLKSVRTRGDDGYVDIILDHHKT